jgi:hypothetical protein
MPHLPKQNLQPNSSKGTIRSIESRNKSISGYDSRKLTRNTNYNTRDVRANILLPSKIDEMRGFTGKNTFTA